MKINLLEAVMKELEGEKARAEANLDVLISNPVGIGEHIDLVTEVKNLVGTITDAEDNLDVVSRKLQEYSNKSLGHFRDRTATLDEYYEGSQ